MNEFRFSTEILKYPFKIKYIKNGKLTNYRAFETKDEIKFQFLIPRLLGISKMLITVFDESVSKELINKEAYFIGIEDADDIYEVVIKNELNAGLYFILPTVKVFNETFYGKKVKKNLFFNSNFFVNDLIQITVSEFKYKEPKTIYGGIIYHIFVDRFSRGEKRIESDNIVATTEDWSVIPEYPEYPGAPIKNNCFFGGTLWGIIEKLDYIESLGVNAIYISPIFESTSNHKYDTANYMKVDFGFGGDKALKALIEETNKRGIKLILDGVFNHTGSDSIYFNKYGRYSELGAYQSKKSVYYPWYEFQEYPQKYTCWWDIDILPRINPDISSCKEYFLGKKGVIKNYSNLGIYGFRLDVADELSDSFIAGIKASMSQGKESIVYGEVWEDASNKIAYGKRKKYYLGSELDGVMNYPLRSGLIDYVLDRNCDKLDYALREVLENTPKRILHAQMNLLGSHDTERILTVLGNKDVSGMTNRDLSTMKLSQEEKKKAIKLLKCLYTVISTLPGIPTIFYGDEAGLEGYADPFNRMPFPWNNIEDTLLEHYKKIGKIRRENNIYKKGEYKLLILNEKLLIFSRFCGINSYITVLNNSKQDITLIFSDFATELLSKVKQKRFVLSQKCAYIFKTKSNSLDIEQ